MKNQNYNSNDPILFWNNFALEIHRCDFTPQQNEEESKKQNKAVFKPLMPEQRGPTATSRALAIVHLAMYDAWFKVRSLHLSLNPNYYLNQLPNPRKDSSVKAAVAGAATQTLRHLFLLQDKVIQFQLDNYVLKLLNEGELKINIELGLKFGESVGQLHLNARKNDNSTASNPFEYLQIPGTHQPDPFDPTQSVLGHLWGDVKPFGIEDINQIVENFAPPLGKKKIGEYLSSSEWAKELNEVQEKGSRNAECSGERTAEETVIGLFWAYDGAEKIGTPPRLYNQCVQAISKQLGLTTDQNAQLFALINMSMADAGIAAWKEKYTYHVARPVIGVRHATIGYGENHGSSNPTFVNLSLPPSNASFRDTAHWLEKKPKEATTTFGNITTETNWAPLGAPQTNKLGVFSRTPNFPAYPSGHSTFGSVCFGAVAAMLAAYKPDVDIEKFEFEFVSDELDGKSLDSDGSQRTFHSRKLTLAQAIHENALSRIYLGVHYRMDAVEGVRLGQDLLTQTLAQKRGPACFQQFNQPNA